MGAPALAECEGLIDGCINSICSREIVYYAFCSISHIKSQPANPPKSLLKSQLPQFSTQVETIQNTLGISEQSTSGLASKSSINSSKKAGIDVVLGSQWGDEGKGKLVDMLSQVSVF